MIANCCSVSVEGNEQRGGYLTAEQELENYPEMYSDMDPDVRAECIRQNVLVKLQLYPETPVGFLVWVHYDLEALLSEAYSWCVSHKGAPPHG
jgi:hypothetical protein